MIFNGYGPLWFLGIDVIFEAIFFLVTLFIAWYAWRIYRFGGGKPYETWSLGFLLISFSYLMSGVFNYLIYHELIEKANEGFLQVLELNSLYRAGIFLHDALFLLGFLLLLLVSLRVDDRIVDGSLAAFMILIALGATYFQALSPLAVIILLTGIIIGTYRQRQGVTLVIAGLAAVLLAHVVYLFLTVASLAYALGHVLELVGFGLLAINMIIILSKK